ncbi:hypothetical protein BGZ72_010170 [Mortierella alpina]|nr:hypothetical protein BGZ72_010170 [Mortierella alpina]
MLSWTELTGIALTRPMPDIETDGNQTLTNYAAAWSSVRGSLLVVGGSKGTVVSKSLLEYNTKTNTWAKAGTVPRPEGLLDACMVSAYNGTKMVAFGGNANTTPPSRLGTVYILDVKTMKWTTGATVAASQSRSGMACAAAGDNFVVWGDQDSSDTSNNAYLIGGFAAAVVVLAIIAIVGYRRYRHKKPKELPKEGFYADFEHKHHHADERGGQPMDEDYLRERMAHHPQRSPRISPPILDTYSARSPSPDDYDRRMPSEEYHRRAPSPEDYNRRSPSPVYEMPLPVLMARSTPTPPPSRRAAVAAAAAAAGSDDGRHGSKASYQGSDGGRRGARGGGRGSNSGSGSGSAIGAAGGGGGGGYVSDSDDPTTPRHDMSPRSYSPSRYRQPRFPHPNTPSPRPMHSQSSPSQQHQQQQQQHQQYEPHSLTTLTPVHQGNRVRPLNNNGRDQQAHPDDFRAMDDATLYSQMKVMMQAVDERNRR